MLRLCFCLDKIIIQCNKRLIKNDKCALCVFCCKSKPLGKCHPELILYNIMSATADIKHEKRLLSFMSSWPFTLYT